MSNKQTNPTMFIITKKMYFKNKNSHPKEKKITKIYKKSKIKKQDKTA